MVNIDVILYITLEQNIIYEITESFMFKRELNSCLKPILYVWSTKLSELIISLAFGRKLIHSIPNCAD